MNAYKTKEEARKYYASLRKNLETEYVKNASLEICKKIMADENYKKARSVAAYMAIGNEIDLSLLISDVINNKKLFLPKVLDGENMEFYEISDISELKVQSIGILEPYGDLKKAYFNTDTLIIVPGIVFDKDGYRYGYGKGYYDRYFFKGGFGCKIGVCYDRLLCEKLPQTTEFDMTSDIVVTENEIHYVKDN